MDDSVNDFWRVRGFHNYADYALGDEFGAALSELIDVGTRQLSAIMCSEAVWWRCHRRIITDYLLMKGHEVDHLMSPGHREQAKLTPSAEKTREEKVTYPASKQAGQP